MNEQGDEWHTMYPPIEVALTEAVRLTAEREKFAQTD